MKKPIFEIKNLNYTKNDSTLLNIKKFEIHRGACYVFNGNMASGKTLLLDILTKNNKKYNGDILYENESIKQIPFSNYIKEIAYVKQSIKAPYFQNVETYIKGILKRSYKNDGVDKQYNDILKTMDFKYMANVKMRDLTPGQLRWVDLASNIALFPKVLFIDELELHLSMSKIKNLVKILYRKVNYEGVTIIATTQNKEFFSNLISVSININNGRITSVRSKRK